MTAVKHDAASSSGGGETAPATSVSTPASMSARPRGGWRLLWWRFNRFLERHLPEDLYRRTLLIVVLPILLLLLVIIGILLDRHWEEVTKRLSKDFSRQVALVVRLYDAGPKTPQALQRLQETVRDSLDIGFSIDAPPLPPLKPRPWYSILHYRLSKYVSRFVPGRPFWIDASSGNHVEVRILADERHVLRFRISKDRVYATSTPYLLLWMSVAAAIVLALALAFLRKQISPILDLAAAMRAFGKGQSPPPLPLRGAREVKQATEAFIAMQQRLQRHVEQRTTMLAGISHDMRTILTRFRLELSLLDADAQHIASLKQDVDEMQRMLQGYVDFARGAEGEPVREVDLCALLCDLRAELQTHGKQMQLTCPASLAPVHLRPGALRRAVRNVLANALRHARAEVHLSAKREGEHLRIIVDDDGPGIPPQERERVFRPFVRLDEARNLDAAGTGLGLAIARDLVLSHGGRIELADSPLGGLRVIISLPA